MSRIIELIQALINNIMAATDVPFVPFVPFAMLMLAVAMIITGVLVGLMLKWWHIGFFWFCGAAIAIVLWAGLPESPPFDGGQLALGGIFLEVVLVAVSALFAKLFIAGRIRFP